MSSLLRVSRILGRQRVLLQSTNPSISATRRRTLSASWAPPAYRSVRPGNKASLRGKRRSPKKSERGRDGLYWKALQSVYGEPTTTTTDERDKDRVPTTNKEDDWRAKRLHRRQVKLLQSQEELRKLLHRYRNALFPNTPSKKYRKGSMTTLLRILHDLCTNALQDKETLVVSMDTIDKAENQFRDLGKLTRQVISCVVRIPEQDIITGDDQDKAKDGDLAEHDNTKVKNSVLAEHLLRGLIELKEDRALLVQRAEEALKQQEEASKQQDGTVVGWLKNIFSFSSEDKDQEQEKPEEGPIPLRAHEEESFGPTNTQYGQVIKSIRRDAYALTWEPTQDIFKVRAESKEARDGLLECANRMSTVLNLYLQHGGIPKTTMSLPAMELYARVGSLQAAKEANRIYTEVHAHKVPRFVFHSLLKAYRLAALMEETFEARAEAATTAIALLQEREEYSLATAYYSAPDEKDPRVESYKLVLETLENAGHRALPDRCQQAEVLLKLFLGEKVFHQVVNYSNTSRLPKSAVDLQMFESLLLMYTANGGDSKLLQRAKNILKCARDQQAATARSKKSSDNDEKNRVFPNTRSYNSVLRGIQMNVKIMMNNRDPGSADEAKEATALLDHMTQSPCRPNLQTYELLAEIWALVESPESGQHVEEILSRMSLLQACTGRRDAWSDTCRVYSLLLHCWAKGLDASSSAALHRALRILDKMEAKSGIQFMPGPDAPQEEKDIFHSVYEQNETESYRAAYNGALLICSLCRDDSEEAFQTAFDIYNRMIAAGITPDKNTYRNLFAACCLPGGDEDNATDRRRELASTVIAFASDHGMNTTEMNRQMARRFHKRKKTNKV